MDAKEILKPLVTTLALQARTLLDVAKGLALLAKDLADLEKRLDADAGKPGHGQEANLPLDKVNMKE
jgi:hypothetical protein